MSGNSFFIRAATGLFSAALAAACWAGTFGTVIPIGGQASDVALDEIRGVLYIANFTANRIDVMGLADHAIHKSMNVAPQPGAMALSPDSRYLVVAHFGNFEAPATPNNALTVIDLSAGTRQTFGLGFPPLGVAFGVDGLALVVTSNDFLLLDPVSGATVVLDTVEGVTANTLPVPPANFPPQIIAASMAASPDGLKIFGMTDTIYFSYDVYSHRVVSVGYTASPTMGPRVVSVARGGKYFAAGWGLFDATGYLRAEFPSPTGDLSVGSVLVDSDAGLIYAQVPSSVTVTTQNSDGTTQVTKMAALPRLQIVDADNLAVRETLRLQENLAGRSVLNSARDTMYSVSDSGVMILPVGSLNQQHRVAASQEDLLFRSSFCDRRATTQSIQIVNPGGGHTDFAISGMVPGMKVSPSAGTTPATVQVTVDPNVFPAQSGTTPVSLTISSGQAVNVPRPLRVLVNSRAPDQRGTIVNVPGKLVDILPDPIRNRFYVLRQDTNQVLVFDGTSYAQIATLRTSNTPTQMAITVEGKFLLIGHDDAQVAYVYDLDSLEMQPPIVFPGGHYPRSIAASGAAVLAACRVAGPVHTIDRVDMLSHRAWAPASLGVFKNDVNINTVLTASPNGGNILAASADGTLRLYNAVSDTFTVARQDFQELAGAYAASSYDRYIVDNHVLNASLVEVTSLDGSTGASSGFAFVDAVGIRSTVGAAGGAAVSGGSTTSLSGSSAATDSAQATAGVMQRVDAGVGIGIRPTRMAEAPLAGDAEFALTRTLAPLSNRQAIVSLTTSGFTVLSWDYDAAVAPPVISAVVNAADFSLPVAPGGLISVFGQQLSPLNMATRELPVPTALGESCLTVNGTPVPMLFVSSGQINAQLPFNASGNSVMVLRTPGGISDSFNFNVLPVAPSVFRSGTAGPDTGIPTVVRLTNGELVTGSNPVHPDDNLVIYATGMGQTSPSVDAGIPAPVDPLPLALVPPEVSLGGVSLPVLYAGLAPGQVGVYQINVSVPYKVPLGMSVPLVISQGGMSTTLSVRVVK